MTQAMNLPSQPAAIALGAAMVWAMVTVPLGGLLGHALPLHHLFGTAADAAPAAPRPADPAPSAEELRRQRERDSILGLIRDYRKQADERSRKTLAETIHREARAASVDPLLVAAIVARESSFRSHAVSRKGAVGLMQIRPWVARDVAAGAGVEWNGVETLRQPDRNVRIGALYYRELLDRFDGDHERALTAYNCGPTRVRRQIANGTYHGSAYARRILALYASIRDGGEV